MKDKKRKKGAITQDVASSKAKRTGTKLKKPRPLSRILTLDEFLEWARISESTYYGLKRQKLGPKTIRIGRSIVRISERSAKLWLKRMERGDAEDFKS